MSIVVIIVNSTFSISLTRTHFNENKEEFDGMRDYKRITYLGIPGGAPRRDGPPQQVSPGGGLEAHEPAAQAREPAPHSSPAVPRLQA